MSTTKTYALTSTRQLIDLNGDIKNFILSFSVTSKDGKDFDALVVDQTTLDRTSSDFDYKKTVDGVIAGEIRSDKDIYQNYYLILKSDEKRDVDVVIDIQEIEPAPQENVDVPPPQQRPEFVAEPPVAVTTPKTSSVNWKLIIIVIIVIGGGFLLYKFYMAKKISTDVKPSANFKPVAPINVPPVAPINVPPVAPTLAPVAPTLAPVAPTLAPVAPTPSPAAPTPSPAAPTPSPVAPTPSPVAPLPVTEPVTMSAIQSSPSILPVTSSDSIKSFGFSESKVNRGLLARLNSIKLN